MSATWPAAIALVLVLAAHAAILSCDARPASRVKTHASDGYVVYEIQGVLTAKECANLIDFARTKGMDRSEVWADKNTLNEASRKSKQTWILDEEHRVAEKMAKVAELFSGIDKSHQEQLQVAMYEPRGMFVDHYDACVSEDPENCLRMNKGSGQRRATLLVYLNDDFEGGETEFGEVGFKIKPATGKGIFFWSTREDESLITESKHRGNEVLGGSKWIATKWTHKRAWI